MTWGQKLAVSIIVFTGLAAAYGYVIQQQQTTAEILDHINNQQQEHTDDVKKQQWLAQRIVMRYTSTDYDLAAQITQAAFKYQDAVFPKADDIIAIIAIESIFNPKAKSNLKHDPAKGLMQIRHGVWKDKINVDNMNRIESQIKHGSEILAHYYRVVDDKNKAIMAYNVGLTAALNGRTNPKYLAKYKREMQAFRLPPTVY